MRLDAAARGLSYELQLSDNLVSNVWNSSGYIPSAPIAIDAEFEAVTNSILTDSKNEQFMKLNVTLDE